MASSNKTAGIGLNLWEPEDQVKRLDFNADNQSIDDAFSSLTQSVSRLGSDIRSELSADTAALESLVAEEKAALQAQIDSFPYVKIFSTTTTAAASQIICDLGNLNLLDYARVEICVYFNPGQSGSTQILANGVQISTVGSHGSGSMYVLNTTVYPGKSVSGAGVNGVVSHVSNSGSAGSLDKQKFTLPSNILSQITISHGTSTTATYAAGAKIFVHGVRA